MNSPTTQPRCAARGFTLLELIISVALVLVLMLAVTKIFSITSATIGATQGIAAATRDARAAQAVFARDMAALASDSPFIWIRYEDPVPAFRNSADMQSDKDYPQGTFNTNGSATNTGSPNQVASKLTIDIDENGSEGELPSVVPGEIINSLTINNRNHRLDRISFCARDSFIRQTGNTNLPNDNSDDVLVARQSSSEAWITYGHLVLPQVSGQFTLRTTNGSAGTVKANPGSGTELSNSGNFYASQWVLGRMALLMVLPENAPSANPNGSPPERIVVGGADQEFIRRNASWTAAGQNNNMTPLSDGSTAGNSSGALTPTVNIRDSRYDLVGIDIYNARDRISRHINYEKANPGTGAMWYGNMLADRSEVNPFIIKPINARSASQQVPLFLSACSQFIVEYAGDFVTQRPDGSLNTAAASGGLVPDGQVDFYFNKTTGDRQIQWFGYPRSQDGSRNPTMAQGDVGLVGDFVHYISGAGQTPVGTSPFARYSDIAGGNFAAWERFGKGDIGGFNAATTARNNYVLKDTYTAPIGTVFAAWGPDDTNRPKMFRITVAIDRPEMAGRSADPQTFEYVFNVP